MHGEFSEVTSALNLSFLQDPLQCVCLTPVQETTFTLASQLVEIEFHQRLDEPPVVPWQVLQVFT